MGKPEIAEVRSWLEGSERAATWLQDLEDLPAGKGPMSLPDARTADELLQRLGVDDEDRALVLEHRPDLQAHKALWWILERAYGDLIAKMGKGEVGSGFRGWPPLPESTGMPGGFGYVWVLLAVLPELHAFQAERGIPDNILWTGLRNISEDLAITRRINGRPGLDSIWSSPLIFRASLFSLGRLMFNWKAVPGGTISVHIPSRLGGGPMSPEACNASIARAADFFPKHFPDLPFENFSCTSWLLDSQLADYLPEDSNMLKFQRRFEILPYDKTAVERTADVDVLRFVFERTCDGPEVPGEILDDLPQDTKLQRAYAAHLRAGEHLYWVTGTFKP